MARVNVKDFSKSRPVITPDMFPRADIIPFTIRKVEYVDFKAEGDGDAQKRIVLLSKEHGENVLWLNVTGIKALVARLGDDDEGWVGETIPLVKVRTTNPQSHEAVQVLWVAGANDDDAWEEVGGRRRRGVAKQETLPLKVARGATAKRGAKRGTRK